MDRDPSPIPTGWCEVATSGEVANGEVVTRRAFGTEVVLWRDAGGHIVCQEARCPHHGAHLGAGGTVVGGCLRCPFHGWCFRADGTNATVPHGEPTLPTHPAREHAGIVFAWYDPTGAEPDHTPQEHLSA